jgi:tetratricopeptide (TPR) repeat protein
VRLLVRWCAAVAGTAVVFAAAWGLCAQVIMLDPGAYWAIAGLAAAAALAVLSWWAPRIPESNRAANGVDGPVSSPQTIAIRQMSGLVIGQGAVLSNPTINILDHSDPDTETPLSVANRTQIIVGDIPQKPPGFQPRRDLLAELDAPGEPQVPVVHAITGMRGVGKTHLAAAYARARLADGWKLVAWINGQDTGTILSGLTSVATRLGLSISTSADVGEAVRHWLEVDGRHCLLVFDNAADPDRLRQFLPAAGSSQILITSTLESVGNLGVSVPVQVFSEDEARTFLAERTGRSDANDAALLAAEVGRLPLALAQAAAVISAQRLDYATYLRRLRNKPVEELLTRVEGGQYPSGLAAAVLLSLDAVRAADSTGVSSAVLDIVSVLSPAGVSRLLLHAAGAAGLLTGGSRPNEVPPEMVDNALGRLAGSSILTFSVDYDWISVHRLIMRIAKERNLKQESLETICLMTARFLEMESKSIMGQVWQNRATARELVEHIAALHENSAPIRNDSDELTGEMLSLRGLAQLLLNELGDSARQAVLFGEPLIADYETNRGGDHPGTLQSWNNLANAYQAAGSTDKAISLHKKTLAERERVLGGDHRDTLRSRNNLANAYRAAGRTSEAISLLERTLADRERILGSDHPETLRSRNNLAKAYGEAGRTDQAVPLHERTLADRERVLGSDHPSALQSRNNLANAYLQAGRTDEAVSLAERALADRERILGEDHPDTLGSRNVLANAYLQAGRTDDAIALFERTLAERERILSENHPDTLQSRNNLANAYLQAGRTDDAVTLLNQTLADCQRVLGDEHPLTRTVREGLEHARNML